MQQNSTQPAITNPIIKYGKRHEAFLAEQEALNKQKEQDEMASMIAEITNEFTEAFKSVINDINDSGLTYKVHFPAHLIVSKGNAQIKFTAENGRTWSFDFAGKKHYRYESSQTFGEWPVDLLLWHLYNNLFKQT